MVGTQNFRAVKLFSMLMVIHVIKHLSKPIECTTPRVSPSVSCER